MIEAVGHENLPAYFDAISGLLKPGGQAVIQVNTPLCILRYHFPAGTLPFFLLSLHKKTAVSGSTELA